MRRQAEAGSSRQQRQAGSSRGKSEAAAVRQRREEYKRQAAVQKEKIYIKDI